MRQVAVTIILGATMLCLSCSGLSDYQPQSGDIVFQDHETPDAMAIKLATGSDITHCGIVFEDNGKFVVYEATTPQVRVKPLDQWITQAVGGKIVAKRLTPLGKYLTPAALAEMHGLADRMVGKPFDDVLNWSNEQVYCSELVWKVYYEGFGLELAPLRRLGSYDLSSEAVRIKLQERYGENIPRNEPAIAPSDLIDSKHLYTVY